jgi:hypothetical protein
MSQPLILCKAMDNKIYADDVYKVEVQTSVDNEVYDFLASIPPLVDVDVSL